MDPGSIPLAFVRLKVAKVQPEMEEDEEGNLKPKNTPEEELDEIPISD